MTVKEFFKSKTFRCIVVLMCIALVAGALLSIMNDLLFVSPEERVARTVKSIYGQEMAYTVVYDRVYQMALPEDARIFYEYTDGRVVAAQAEGQTYVGFVNSVYRLEDGNYLIKATGMQGYKQGTITVWCVARMEGEHFVELRDVSVAEYDKQTLMSKFTKSVLGGYRGTEPFDAVVSGATYSSTALNNALNVALSYMQGLDEEGNV